MPPTPARPAADVAIISRRMAERPGRIRALHQQIAINDRTLEIVGVVGDVHSNACCSRRPRTPMSIIRSSKPRCSRGRRGAAHHGRETGHAAVREIVRNAGSGMSGLTDTNG